MVTFLKKGIIGKGTTKPTKVWIYRCNSCNQEFWTNKRITNKEMKTAKCSLCKREENKNCLLRLIKKIKNKSRGDKNEY